MKKKTNKKPISEKTQEISKFKVDEKDLKAETIPNPVVLGGPKEIGLTRLNPIDIPKYLLMHPALPRGIEIKANRMIKLVDEDLESNVVKNKYATENEIEVNGIKTKISTLAEEAVEYNRNILYNSNGALLLKQHTMEAYRFGTSFIVLQTNMSETEVLRFELQHPIFFGPAKYPNDLKKKGVDWMGVPMSERISLAGKMKIDPKTKTIAKYTQLTKKVPSPTTEGETDSSGYVDNYKAGLSEYVDTRSNPELKEYSSGQLTPIGDEFDKDYVIQLMFDRIGDEVLGISLVQFLHLTINYLLNMEKAGAQTMVNFGFNKWKAETPFKDQGKMQAFGQSLSKIQTDSVVVLPKDIKLDNIEPGTTEFDKVHPIYLQLIATRLGIPLPLLTQTGTETNKATLQEQRKDMYEDFIADELAIEMSINDGFFKACQIKWPDLTIKELNLIVPKFKFNQPPEDLDSEMERNLKFSLMNRNDALSIKMLIESGVKDVANVIAERLKLNVMKELKLTYGVSEIIERKMIPIKSIEDKSSEEEPEEIDNQIEDIKKKKDEKR